MWSRRLPDRLGQWCEQLGSTPPDATYLTLTLRSPAIVRDPFGRFRAALDGDTIGGWCDQALGALEVRQAFVTTTAVEGWNSALGLPKPDALALAAGSCWLLRVPPGTASDVDTAMERLEQDGIGERRQEGFGAVACCDPVHWRINELELERMP